MSRRPLAVACGLAVAVPAGYSSAGGPTAAFMPRERPAATAVTGSTTVPGAAGSGPRLNAALLAAFLYVWFRLGPALDREACCSGVRAMVAAAYARLLADNDPAHVAAHAATCDPRAVLADTAVLVADVPIDVGLSRVAVPDTGGRWLITGTRPESTP